MNVLVVARFLEDVGWLDSLPKGWKALIVQKDKDLPNEGREASSFLWAMRKLRARPPGTVGFCQGDPFPHCPYLYDALSDPVTWFRWLGDPNYTSDADGHPHDAGVPVKELHERYVGEWPGEVRFAAGGQFVMPGTWLRRYSVKQYQEMQAQACEGRAAWGYERLWAAMFPGP